jgi:hypothetical protein
MGDVVRNATRKLNVIPAKAGTQVTCSQRPGSLSWGPSPRGSRFYKAPDLGGPVNWPPAFAGVTPTESLATSQRRNP